MNKTLFVTHFPGGGVWGLKQLVQAEYIEEQTGLSMSDLSDVHISSSIGAVPSNGLLVPHPNDPSRPKFKARDLIKPFKACAEQIFGPDGIDVHYQENVKHDLRHTMECGSSRVNRMAARILPDRTGKLHKPHDLLGGFLNNYLGDAKVSDLIKSSITQVHHMDAVRRSCFSTLKSDLFDADLWPEFVIANHGGDVAIADAVMATTAAPTVFNRYEIDGKHYVDFDHIYTPNAAVQSLMHCLRNKPRGFAFSDTDGTDIKPRVKILRMSCGVLSDVIWDQAVYQNQGPLAMMKDLNGMTSLDQQRTDHGLLQLQYGRDCITTIGASVPQEALETETTPSSSIFDGNRSNLNKIEGLARAYIETQRERIMRYADMVTETRARENVMDPTSAFGVANVNSIGPMQSMQVVIPQAQPKPSFLSGVLRRFRPSITA